MIKAELKEESPNKWKIVTEQGVELGSTRLCSLFQAIEWSRIYLSSWSETFDIMVVQHDGSRNNIQDILKAQSS